MNPLQAKLVRELKTIARRDGWSSQRTKSMLGILKGKSPYQQKEMLRTIRERRPT